MKSIEEIKKVHLLGIRFPSINNDLFLDSESTTGSIRVQQSNVLTTADIGVLSLDQKDQIRMREYNPALEIDQDFFDANMSDEESDDENRQRFKLSKTHQLINQLEHKLQLCSEDSHNSPNFYGSSRDSHLKSKLELERELQDFEQRMRKLNQLDNSQLQSSQARSIQKSSPQKLNLSNPVLQLLTQKLENYDDDKHNVMTTKLDHLNREQQILEQEQVNLLREQQQAKFELESLMRTLEIEEQRKLNEQKLLILKEQEEKLLDIQDQSEKLIQEEEQKKTNFFLELQQLSFEKNQLQTQLNNISKEQEMLASNRDDISNQLSTLMQLHNQMLQNDLKKKIVHLEEEDEEPQVKPLDNLYQINQQMQESMNQQLSLIRQELNEQKQINLDLLQLLNGEQQQISQRQMTGSELVEQQKQSLLQQGTTNNQIEEESEESLIMVQKYSNCKNPKVQNEFDQLFDKHKKQYFKPPQKKQTKTTTEKRRKSIELSKSKEKDRGKENVQKKPTTFEDTYKKHINDQLKRLNSIVKESLKKPF